MSTATVDFQVSGKTVEEITANAEAAVKELAAGRDYTFEVRHLHGSWNFDPKSEPERPETFCAQVTARMEGLPPSFRDELVDRGMDRW